VLVKPEARGVQLRWYPGELSADKFEVQVKMLDTLRAEGFAFPGERPLEGEARLRMTAGQGIVATDVNGKLYTGRNVTELAARRLATQRAAAHGGAHGHGAGAGSAADDAEGGGGPGGELWAESPEETWATVYTGAQTFASVTGLFANSVYRFRVVAYNSAGVPSRPSPETQIVTGGNGSVEPLSVANAARMFVVECVPAPISDPGAAHMRGRAALSLQDIVLGDVVLFTEDVFLYAGPDVDPYHPAAPREVPESHPRAEFFCSRTVAAQVIADSASRMTAGSGASANIADPAGPAPVGATATALAASGYLAGVRSERVRTAAGGHVVSVRPPSALSRRRHDAGVGATDSGTRHGGAPTCIEDALAGRALTLQVEWSTVSKARAASAVLHPGAIVRRRAVDLGGLDMYRTLWRDEAGRWSLAEEMRASYDV